VLSHSQLQNSELLSHMVNMTFNFVAKSISQSVEFFLSIQPCVDSGHCGTGTLCFLLSNVMGTIAGFHSPHLEEGGHRSS